MLVGEEHGFFYDSLEDEIKGVMYSVIQRNYYLREMNFVGNEKNECLIEQEIWEKGDVEYKVKEIVKVLSEYGVSYEKDKNKIENIYEIFLDKDRIVEFSSDYSQYMTYGLKIFNLLNKKVQLLIIYWWLLNTISEDVCVEQTEIESFLYTLNRSRD